MDSVIQQVQQMNAAGNCFHYCGFSYTPESWASAEEEEGGEQEEKDSKSGDGDLLDDLKGIIVVSTLEEEIEEWVNCDVG